MARIGILTCSNATQDLGCSSVVCLADMRKRKGAFSEYQATEKLTLVGIINCPGCPTLAGSEKLMRRIRGLTEFGVDAVHFTNCVAALCPFRDKYKRDLEHAFPNMTVVLGTHEPHLSAIDFREEVKGLFKQPQRSMVDVILQEDVPGSGSEMDCMERGHDD